MGPPEADRQRLLYRLAAIDRLLAESRKHIAKMEVLIKEAELQGLDDKRA
jgi:hypothetical protein